MSQTWRDDGYEPAPYRRSNGSGAGGDQEVAPAPGRSNDYGSRSNMQATRPRAQPDSMSSFDDWSDLYRPAGGSRDQGAHDDPAAADYDIRRGRSRADAPRLDLEPARDYDAGAPGYGDGRARNYRDNRTPDYEDGGGQDYDRGRGRDNGASRRDGYDDGRPGRYDSRRDYEDEPARRPEDRYDDEGEYGRSGERDGSDRHDGASRFDDATSRYGAAGRYDDASRYGATNRYEDASRYNDGASDYDSAGYYDETGRPGRGPQSAEPVLPGEPAPGKWGALSGKAGISIAAGTAILGMLISVMLGLGPGLLLSIFVLGGTVAAGLGIQRRLCYLIIPIPAVVYFFCAMPLGYASDPASHGSRTALAVAALQWMAQGFSTIVLATVLAVGIALTRWFIRSRWWLNRRDAGGGSGSRPQPSRPQQRPPRSGRSRSDDSWRSSSRYDPY